mmetsp:Transcript_16001/g.41412  ORF Transcript_16001/g.41412 Transcript_16001/m.41412 type:complete len:771 (+) Transcript_16001:142-2454(+)
MGRYNKRKKWGKGQGGRPKRHRDDKHVGWTEIPLKSEAFERYYKAQNLMPFLPTGATYSPTGARYGAVATQEFEWDVFMAKLREVLPTSFRVTGTKSSAVEFREMLKTRFFSKMEGLVLDGQDIAPPNPIKFYPDDLAWQMNVSRGALRKEGPFNDFHKFLVAMNEKGNLSRQEAVSMIPPLLLDVQPEHTVLDMCAAPGSKTAQLIEMLHAGDAPPAGMVIANDVENKRCYTLTHQTKRLQSPNFVVTNLDATRFPSLWVPDPASPGQTTKLLFDRVLCDVPCSGDGTMRKNRAVWKNWNPMNAVGLHKVQTKIVYRGAQLLRVGGRLVYSTCSFNPVENEAVVASLLRKAKGSMELVDVSEMLPELKRRPGLSHWTVIEKYGRELPSHHTTDPQLKKQFVSSIWPPTAEEAEWMHLERCVRVYPQQQNTGGFFICAFRKIESMSGKGERSQVAPAAPGAGDPVAAKAAPAPMAVEPSAEVADAPAEGVAQVAPAAAAADGGSGASSGGGGGGSRTRNAQQGYKEDPYVWLEQDGDTYWPPIKEFYGFSEAYPERNLFTRSEKEVKRHIYFVSDSVRQLLQTNEISGIRIINAGVKVFTRSDAINRPCDFRICMDGLQSTWTWLEKRVARCTLNDLGKAIRQDGVEYTEISELLQAELKAMPIGCTILHYDPAADPSGELACALQVVVWRGENSVRTLVSKDDRKFFCALLGIANVDEEPTTRKRDHGEAGAAAAAAPADGDAVEVSAPKRVRAEAEGDVDETASMDLA